MNPKVDQEEPEEVVPVETRLVIAQQIFNSYLSNRESFTMQARAYKRSGNAEALARAEAQLVFCEKEILEQKHILHELRVEQNKAEEKPKQ